MKYPKEYLDEIKTRLKVSSVVSKTVSLKKEARSLLDYRLLKMKKNSILYGK
jgi:DNA primase